MATDRAVIHQLLAMRETIDSLLAMLAPSPDAVQPCTHQAKEDLTTFGGPGRWHCLQCGYEHEEADDAS